MNTPFALLSWVMIPDDFDAFYAIPATDENMKRLRAAHGVMINGSEDAAAAHVVSLYLTEEDANDTDKEYAQEFDVPVASIGSWSQYKLDSPDTLKGDLVGVFQCGFYL